MLCIILWAVLKCGFASESAVTVTRFKSFPLLESIDIGTFLSVSRGVTHGMTRDSATKATVTSNVKLNNFKLSRYGLRVQDFLCYGA